MEILSFARFHADISRMKTVVNYRHPANVAVRDSATRGDRVADAVVRRIGTWRFLGAQTAGILLWIFGVSYLNWAIDNHQLTILNLILSCQAAITGPLLLLASNRSAKHDRMRAEADHTILSELRTVNAQQLNLITSVHDLSVEIRDQRGT